MTSIRPSKPNNPSEAVPAPFAECDKLQPESLPGSPGVTSVDDDELAGAPPVAEGIDELPPVAVGFDDLPPVAVGVDRGATRGRRC